MFIILTTGVDFTNILRAAFTCADSKKIQSNFQYLFALLGSAWVKASCKMLMKLTLGGRAGCRSTAPPSPSGSRKPPTVDDISKLPLDARLVPKQLVKIFNNTFNGDSFKNLESRF